MGLIDLDLKQILPIIGVFAAFIGWLIMRAKYKNQGRQEIINRNHEINVLKILDFNKKSEALKGKEYDLKDCVPNDNATLERLSREKGITRISEFTDGGLCEEMSGRVRSDKTPDAS